MNQQSEFEERTRAVNPDPREQVQVQYQDQVQDSEAYQAGYAAAMRQRMEGQFAEKIYPQPRRRRGRRRLWIAVAILVVLFVLGSIAFNALSFTTSDTFPGRIFKVSTLPKIVINARAATVSFHTDPNNNDIVSIAGTEVDDSIFVKPKTFYVDATQDTKTNTITINEQKVSSDNAHIDLEITLPANSNLQVSLNTGDITVDGVSGSMDLKDTNGQIVIQNSTLTGTSTIREDTGDILFQSVIKNDGDYTFEDKTGAINLIFPNDQKFTLDGKATNTFNPNDGLATPGSHIHLHVKNNTGAINISKG